MTDPLPICDRCGLPVDPALGRYTLADEFDEDTGAWTVARHIECHMQSKKNFEAAGKRVDELIKLTQAHLQELRGKL